MKMKVLIKPVSVMFSLESFEKIKSITDQTNVAISEYIRNVVEEKLSKTNEPHKEIM